MAADPDAMTDDEPAPGDRVEVRDGFEGHWQRGFVVDEVTPDGYRVRRVSDDVVLPRPIAAAAIRRERRRSMWWI
ncbi:MAG: hypothetical protein GXY13_09725 [Acidimicrobiales bacterium]|nr:hypothetical protein [Acidimicrobiales bacterium]